MQTYTIISVNSVLYLKVQGKLEARIIAELFTGNPELTKLSRIQTASIEFKERLKLLDALGDSSYNAKKFFTDIPTNQHFLFLRGKIKDDVLIHLYRKEISLIEDPSYKYSEIDKVALFMSNHYEVSIFLGTQRRRIGTNNKRQRICRFCGKSMPDITFKQKAHAISESLGNKGLICLEECDDCNRHFNETIEQDIGKLLRFQLILNGIKGKNGNPTLKGDGASIKNDTSSCVFKGKNTLLLEIQDSIDFNVCQDIKQFLSQNFSFSREKYTPQNIYKCFCKYVISLIDSCHLPFFRDTIKWINEPIAKHRLPPVWHCRVPLATSPCLVIMTRKHNHKEIPYCWAIINIAGFQFLFIVPFCSQDKYKFVGKNRVKYFLDGLKNIMPNVELKSIDFSGTTPLCIKNELHFDMPVDCVEGRDFFIIKPNT